MNEPKITVIIPTRERRDVLEKSLQTVTEQAYGNLEIIVSDNCGCDGTEELVRSTNDARVKYLNTGRRVSMSHNWEYALSHVTEGWVTIIGDDDGLLPGSVEKVARIIDSADVLAIRSDVCSYVWPSLTKREFGRLGIPLRRGTEARDSRVWLSRVMSGRANYPELPMLYSGGYVSVSVVDRIRAATGSFYQSCIPDVYSAVAISSVIDRYLYVREPLAIRGASRHSTGTSHFSGEEESALSPSRQFASEGNIPFHESVPLCADGSIPPSLQVGVYECYLQSRRLRGAATRDIHAEQLEIILATAGRHEASVRAWARLFAAVHGLSYDSIQSKADRRKVAVRASSACRWVSDVINTYTMGSRELPIKDVYEASIAAARRPSRFENCRRLAVRVVERVSQK